MTYQIETPANNAKGWRRVPDTNFATEESAERYGLKYHTDKYGSRMFRVVLHKDDRNSNDEV